MSDHVLTKIRFHYFLPTACFILLSYGASAFANQAPKRTVSVTGAAEVKVAPDTVVVSLTATHRGENLLKAQNQNDETVSQYLRYLRKKMKLKAKNLQTAVIAGTADSGSDSADDSAARDNVHQNQIDLALAHPPQVATYPQHKLRTLPCGADAQRLSPGDRGSKIEYSSVRYRFPS